MALKVLAQAARMILFPGRGGLGRGRGNGESSFGCSKSEVPVGT